jgi:hypothetical protein
MIEREREFSYIKTAQLQNADFFQKTKIMLERERERERVQLWDRQLADC